MSDDEYALTHPHRVALTYYPDAVRRREMHEWIKTHPDRTPTGWGAILNVSETGSVVQLSNADMAFAFKIRFG